MPYEIKKILVPLDLSETSLNAFRSAASFASKCNAGIILVNINENIFEVNRRKQLHSPHYANPDVLNALLGTLNQSGINARLIQKDGCVTEAVISLSLEEKADLIFMGAHGASGMRDGFIGTNAYNVIKYASCPVLTVPARVKPHSFKKVLYPILPVPESFSNYDTVCKFTEQGSVLDVLGLSLLKMERKTRVLDDLVQKIKPQLDLDKIKVATSWAGSGTVPDEILHYGKMTLPDLVVLSSMIDTIYKPDFIGPNTQKILNCSRIPLLSIK